MSGFDGMDVSEVQSLSGRLDGHVGSIGEVIDLVDRVVGALPDVWSGDDLEAFVAIWNREYRPGALIAAQNLTALGNNLHRQIQQQVQASDELGGLRSGAGADGRGTHDLKGAGEVALGAGTHLLNPLRDEIDKKQDKQLEELREKAKAEAATKARAAARAAGLNVPPAEEKKNEVGGKPESEKTADGDKPTVGIVSESWSTTAGLHGGVSGKSGDANGYASYLVGGSASAEAKLGVGNGEWTGTLGAGAFAGVSAMAGGSFGNRYASVGADAQASVGASANVDAGAKFGEDGIDANGGVDAFAGGTVQGQATESVLGASAQETAGLDAGIGAEAEGSASLTPEDIGFKVQLQAVLGVGVNVDLSASIDPIKTGSDLLHGGEGIVDDGLSELGL